jgi:hypothetical protein
MKFALFMFPLNTCPMASATFGCHGVSVLSDPRSTAQAASIIDLSRSVALRAIFHDVGSIVERIGYNLPTTGAILAIFLVMA